MNTALLGLGGNIGDVLANLQAACRTLSGDQMKIVDCSAVYQSEPWGKTDQPAFLNVVVEAETPLSARELLDRCLAVERSMGRERSERWGPRNIDIDILMYGDSVIDEPGLQVPHPRLHLRSFALLPLLQIAPELTWPGGASEGEHGPRKGQMLASYAPALIRSQPLTQVMARRTFLDTLFQ